MRSVLQLSTGAEQAPECGTLTSRFHRTNSSLVLPALQEWNLDLDGEEAQARC